MTTYSISTFDPSDDGDESELTPRYSGLRRYGLRGPWLELRSSGYDDCSILIEREDVAAKGGE